MSRIKPLKQQDIPELQSIFEAGEKMMGFVPNDGLIMAHQPHILKSFLGLVQSIYAPSEISGGLKRLLGLIVSTASGCEYCQAHAANGAFHQDEDFEKIKNIWDFQTSNLFNQKERAALNVAMKSTMIPNAVTDVDIENLKQYFSEKEIVEIVAVISMYAFLNRWNSTLKTDIENKPLSFFEKLKQ